MDAVLILTGYRALFDVAHGAVSHVEKVGVDFVQCF